MKPKTAILLIVVLLVVLAVIIVRHTDIFRPPVEPAETGKNIWPEALAKAKELTIQPVEGAKIRFVKAGDDWRIAEPVDAKARSFPVSRIVDPLKSLLYERAFAAGQDGAPGVELTGLDRPLWTVTLTDESGASHVLEVGRPVPLSGGRKTYVRKPTDEQTYVVDVDFADRLDKPLKDFRDKTVLELSKDRIVKIRLEGRRTTELLKRDGKWSIAEPVLAPGDQAAAEKLLDKLASLTVDEFVEDNPAGLQPYGLTPGSERLLASVFLTDEKATTKPAEPTETHTLALGAKTKEQVYAKLGDEPGVFLLPASLLDDLQPALIDLRDRRVLPIDVAADVLRVELELPGRDVELVRKEDAWRMKRPFEGRADDDAVSDLLTKLGELKAESFRDRVVEQEGFALAPPRARITIHQAGKEDKRALLIGATSPSGEMTFVKRASSDTVAVVKTGDVQPLLAGPAAYWDTTLLKVPDGAEIVSAVVKRAGVTYELKRDGDAWKLTAPLAAGTDADNVNKILDHLSLLQATKIVALDKTVPDKYAGADKIVSVSFSTVAPPVESRPTSRSAPASEPATKPALRTYSVRIASIGDKSFAWRVGRTPAAVGEFEASLYEAFASAELRDRSVWKVKPDDVRAVQIDVGGRKLELIREGDTWKYPADPYVKIDSEKVKTFLDDLKDLKAERFVTHKGPRAEKFALDAPRVAVRLTPAEGKPLRLAVSTSGEGGMLYAAGQTPGVFLLKTAAADKLAKTLKDFKE